MKLSRIIVYVAAALSMLWILLPFYWVASTSLVSFLNLDSAALFPHPITFENYGQIVLGQSAQGILNASGVIGGNISTETLQIPLLHSLIIALGVVVLTVGLASTCAYAYSRYSFRGSSISFLIILSTRSLPAVALGLPFFILFRTAGILRTDLALVLADTAIALPLSIWILRDFFDTIPRDFEEAAKIDGASRWQAFYLVVLPIVRHGLIAVAIFAFLTSWGELFFALILTSNLTAPPTLLSLRIAQNIQSYNELAAGVVVTVLPPILLAFFFQRYLVRGITGGVLKR